MDDSSDESDYRCSFAVLARHLVFMQEGIEDRTYGSCLHGIHSVSSSKYNAFIEDETINLFIERML